MKDIMYNSKAKSLFCAQLALDKKAYDVIVLELKELTSFTDYFIICSGKSDRQVQAIASHIEMTLKEEGIKPLGIEGYREARWILMDYGDVVVHVFYEPVRKFYDLDKLWGDAPKIEIEKNQ